MVLDTCSTLKLSDFSLACSSKNPPDGKQTFLSDARTWFQPKDQPRPKTEPLAVRREQQDPVTEGWTSPNNCTATSQLYSPFYAAPELFAGSAFSVATDMWSMGCVVFEMLVGRQPFCAGSLEALQEMVCGNTGGGVAGEELGEWSELVHSLLARSPTQRYCNFLISIEKNFN